MIKRNETANRVEKRTGRGFSSTVLVFVCGAVLLGGFFFAARQHFASMDYGMKNSRLRKQIDQLEAEKRRLIYTREVSSSPTEVKRSAKKIGLFDSPAVSSNVITSADPIETKAASLKARTQPLVQKISAVEPVRKPTASAKKDSESAKKLVAAR